MTELEHFNRSLPRQVKELFDIFNVEGFKVGVIGGIPRDFLNKMKMGNDFDVELRPVDETDFLEHFEALPKKLKQRGFPSREKGFKVFEVLLENASVEFTLPRLEHFNDNVHHSNFNATYIADLDYTQGFLRRDFTLNTIMFEYWDEQWKLIDPLNGVSDLKAGMLKACDNQRFVKDPVRFLRALRFSLKLNLEFDITLRTLLKNMELNFSTHYLKTEAEKSLKPLGLLLRCYQLRPEYCEYGYLEKFEEAIFRYEELFPPSSLKKHIMEALFLPVKIRTRVLDVFEFGHKGLFELDLKEVNLGKIRQLSLKELAMSAWVSPLLSFLSRASELEVKKLDWLLKEEGAEFDARFIDSYKSLTIRPDDKTPKELKNIEVLQKKIMALR